MPYFDEIMANAPLGYWRLGEPVGGAIAVDSSGNGRNGTYQGGVTLGALGALGALLSDPGNTAALLDGTTGTVRIGGRAAFSVEGWCKGAQPQSMFRVQPDSNPQSAPSACVTAGLTCCARKRFTASAPGRGDRERSAERIERARVGRHHEEPFAPREVHRSCRSQASRDFAFSQHLRLTIHADGEFRLARRPPVATRGEVLHRRDEEVHVHPELLAIQRSLESGRRWRGVSEEPVELRWIDARDASTPTFECWTMATTASAMRVQSRAVRVSWLEPSPAVGT